MSFSKEKEMTVVEFDAWRAAIEVRLFVSFCVMIAVVRLARLCWSHHHQLAWWQPRAVKAHELRRHSRMLNQMLWLQLVLLAGTAICALFGLWFSVPDFGFVAIGGMVGYFLLDRLRVATWSSVKETLDLPYRDTQIG